MTGPTVHPALTRAATLAREAAQQAVEFSAVDPRARLGLALSELFAALGEESLRYGGLTGSVRMLAIGAAEAYVAVHELDEQAHERLDAGAIGGDVMVKALAAMTVNEGVSPPGTPPNDLALAFVDLFGHLLDPEVEVDPELHKLLTRLAAGVVGVSDLDADLVVGDALDLVNGLGEQGVALVVSDGVARGVRLGDDHKQGREFAEQMGVARPERFALRTGPLDPVRVDVYDEQGQRFAQIGERRGGTEWRVNAFKPDGDQLTRDTISFERAVEALDMWLASESTQ